MGEELFVATMGFGTGLALIIAIGAQNAFVLREGIRGEHVLTIVAICAISDAVLIGLGVSGLGLVVDSWPPAVSLIGWAGGGFLLVYACIAARRAFSTSSLEVETAQTGPSRRAVVLTCLALTWLNPHVYLDTMLFLGSIANGYAAQRWMFGIGAALGSLLWFAALGYGARLLKRLFERPRSWRVLDGFIAVTMAAIGVSLVAGQV